jgi:hypothetical protein
MLGLNKSSPGLAGDNRGAERGLNRVFSGQSGSHVGNLHSERQPGKSATLDRVPKTGPLIERIQSEAVWRPSDFSRWSGP